MIDPIEVKKEIKAGTLQVWIHNENIMLSHIEDGMRQDTVKIGSIEDKEEDEGVW